MSDYVMKKITRFMSICTVATAFSMALVSSTAIAQTRPCADDFRKFCSHVERGNRLAMAECLREHANELSPACRERAQNLKTQFGTMRVACEEDVRNFCGDVAPGQGRIAQCMRAHRSELSEECRNAVAQAMRMRRGMQDK